MKFLSLLSFILIFSSFLNAQLNKKTYWGHITKAEIDFKEVLFEKDAGAVILYEEGKTVVSQTFNNTIYRRIKILNESGIQYANQELLYYSYNNLERIGSLKAQTINDENGVTKTYPIDQKEIFNVGLNEYYSTVKFTFPNVKVGSIIEFEYSLQDDNLYLIDAWRFQHELPTLYSKYEIFNESGLDYTSLMIGDKIVKYSKQHDTNISQWALTNLPSFKSLTFLYNPRDMSERIAFQLRGYYKRVNSAFGKSNAQYTDAITTWKDLSSEMAKDYKTKSNESFITNVTSSIPNGINQKETLLNTYNFFKTNYKWNGFTAINPRLTNRELEKIKTGNVADLNLMFYTILKEKGIKSDMVLLSTRDHGKTQTSFPYLGQFNVAINLVTLSDGTTFLIDASNLENDLGYMPLRNYNHIGLIVDTKNEQFINMSPPISEYHSTQNYNLKDGKFYLTKTDKLNGYFKVKNKPSQKDFEQYTPVDKALDILMNEQKTDVKTDESLFELTRTQFESNEVGNSFFTQIENPIKRLVSEFKMYEENRERPLEFNFPFYYKIDVVLNIPEGFTVEIPKDFAAQNELSTKDVQYFQNAIIKDGKLIFHVEFLLNNPIYTNNYKAMKTFFDKSNLDASKTILLKKN